MRLGYADRNGTVLVSVVPEGQTAVAPSTFGEQSDNPVTGATLALRDLLNGFGQKRLRGESEGRYYYTLNADLSSGPWLKGPSLTSYTPATRDSTSGIDRFFEIGGEIYAANGRYVLDGGTDGTGWTVSKDLGSGNAAVDVAVVQGNYGSSVRYAWVGLGDSVAMYYFDGTTWTQTSGGDVMYSRAYAVDDERFYRFDDTNRMWQLDLASDPRTAANWSSPTARIGTKDHGVVRAHINAAGAMEIFKADDVYTLNLDGGANRLFGDRQFVSATTNGEALGRYGQSTFVTYGRALFRLDPDGGLKPVGPELLPENDSEVRGDVTAVCGSDHRMYAAIKNRDNGESYLMTMTGATFEDGHGRTLPVWHGSIIAALADVTVQVLHQSERGADSGHKLLYMGLSDGTIRKFALSCAANPTACSSYRFSTDNGSVYLPRIYFGFPSTRKALHAAIGEADNFSSSNYAQLSYRTGDGDSFVSIGTDFDAGERKRVDFPDGDYCTWLDALVTLVSSANTASPEVSGFAFSYLLRPLPKEVLQINVLAEDGLVRRDGTPYRHTGKAITDYVELAASLAGKGPFIGPDEKTRQVAVLAPRRTTAYDSFTRQPRRAIAVTLVDSAEDARGTLERLEDFTLEELEMFTLRGLEDL